MKLLFFASDYKIGLSDLLVEQMRFLVQQSEIHLVAVAGDKEQSIGLSCQVSDKKIPIKRIEGLDEHQNFFSLANEICSILNSEQFDFVHVQNNWQLALVVYIKYRYRRNLKIIYTIHGYRHNQFFKSLLAKTIIDLMLFVFADVVFTPSSYVRKRFPFIRCKSHTLFLGVEERYFSSKLTDFKKSHINIIFAGQFRPGKNHKTIIDAVYKYIQKTGITELTLFLPGDGPLKAESIEYVDHLRITNNVVFPGQLSREEIFNLYIRCQIAVIPTNYETFGHCIAEPYVKGLCVMTRKVGVANDIIIDSVNGLFFNDENDLELLFEKYLNNNDTIERIGQKAYEGREEFRWSTICSKYREILETKLTV